MNNYTFVINGTKIVVRSSKWKSALKRAISIYLNQNRFSGSGYKYIHLDIETVSK